MYLLSQTIKYEVLEGDLSLDKLEPVIFDL